MRIRWEAAGGSDIGRVRRGNEDAYLLDPRRGIFLVADGMGGHAAGEIASAIAREVVGTSLATQVDSGAEGDELSQMMEASIHAAHDAITTYAARHRAARGMGTTLTACVVHPDGGVRIGHVGDSRAYRLRGGVLQQLTRDHTWVQTEVDAGRLSPEAARTHPLSHIITRALGADSADTPDLLVGRLLPGDLLLLCTDGLTGKVEDAELERILAAGLPLDERVAELIRAANLRGGDDNITAVLVEVQEA
ncbi:MAG TPA: protein phosphatase 2C domain-containing protein [Longimicrobiaceae bacterium]|nr:protein phosphatase 2C domain-containing protein [Longimicrobiaceae bacterium]